MAYFLKKSNLKKGTYLQIYESFYDPLRKGTAHRSFQALGYVHELQELGIQDPVSFYKDEVFHLNQELSLSRKQDRERLISDETPEKLPGYFPLKNINESLSVKRYLDLVQTAVDFQFNLISLLSSLIYARAVCPCSKAKNFEEVLPKLPEPAFFSLNQLYSGLEYIGSEYEKIIEIYNHQVNQKYPFDTSRAYFDCTNFYFEIDREDDFRRKGPSKENHKDPIVGLGLLLDAHQFPVGMKLYPGNESEKPVIRSVIDELKNRSGISGKTIQVTDKGLNCSENIFHALKAVDGYLFSKSVRQLPQTEQVWVLLPNDYQDVRNRKGELLYQIKECADDFPYKYTDSQGRARTIRLWEKRIATYNPQLAKKQKAEISRQVEKAKTLKAGLAKRSEYGNSAKYVTFQAIGKDGTKSQDHIKVVLNEKAIQKALSLAGYNLLVTSEVKMPAREVYTAYHNLWRIEESFRVMKSQLDARPVYLSERRDDCGAFYHLLSGSTAHPDSSIQDTGKSVFFKRYPGIFQKVQSCQDFRTEIY